MSDLLDFKTPDEGRVILFILKLETNALFKPFNMKDLELIWKIKDRIKHLEERPETC